VLEVHAGVEAGGRGLAAAQDSPQDSGEGLTAHGAIAWGLGLYGGGVISHGRGMPEVRQVQHWSTRHQP
jgi:hypothetical protein